MSTEIEPQTLTVMHGKPQGRKPGGRSKSPLTVAIEALKVDDTLVTGLSVAGVEADDEKRILGNVRSKTGQVSKAAKEAGKEIKFSVFATLDDPQVPDGSVVVYRSI